MQVKIDTKNNLKTDQVRRIPMLVVPSITIVHITDVETLKPRMYTRIYNFDRQVTPVTSHTG